MSMHFAKEQRMMEALLRFNQAWKELTAASKALPDLDVSELYPFFLLDYEKIQPDVARWCLHTASKLLENIPDRVPNPACVHCPYVFAGLDNEGMCVGHTKIKCEQFPEIYFERAAVLPFCQANNIATDGVSDEVLQINYTRKVQAINNEQKDHTGSNCNSTDTGSNSADTHSNN